MMRKTEPPPEPSIEEILASIRRIISDDGEPTAGPAFDPYDSENVKKQTARVQADEPVVESRRLPPPPPIVTPIGEVEQSNAAYPSVDATNTEYNDEIFELTDDCLLQELEASRAAASERKAAGLEGAVDTAAAIEKTVADLASNTPEIDDAEQVSIGSFHPDMPPLPSEEEIAEINSVLTNVVAEMHRITDEKEFEPPVDLERDQKSGNRFSEESSVKDKHSEHSFDPIGSENALMPGMHEPRSASATSSASHATKPPVLTRPSAPATSARKPAWSARNRSAVERPKPTSAPETKAAKSAEAADAAPAAANAAPKKPSPLMEAIATTLVTALADTNERQEKSADNARAADAETAAPGAAPAIGNTQEPLPEEVTASDVDEAALESSAAKQASPDDTHDVSASGALKEEASGTSQAPHIEPPELPSEDASDEEAPSGVPMPSETPQEGDTLLVGQEKAPATPEATLADLDGSQAAELPAGLDDGVQGMLKPMLAAWLDENLPRLVEKALSDELAKRDLLKKQ